MDENCFKAPDGVVYVAQDATNLCDGCAFIRLGCPTYVGGPSCMMLRRSDNRSIIWVRADPAATDLAPREALLAHIADMTAERDAAQAERESLRRELDAALAELERAREVLRNVEFSGRDSVGDRVFCPVCSGYIGTGHEHDCTLSAALAAKGE